MFFKKHQVQTGKYRILIIDNIEPRLWNYFSNIGKFSFCCHRYATISHFTIFNPVQFYKIYFSPSSLPTYLPSPHTLSSLPWKRVKEVFILKISILFTNVLLLLVWQICCWVLMSFIPPTSSISPVTLLFCHEYFILVFSITIFSR